MHQDAMKEKFDVVELFGKHVLFTNFRIDRGTVPAGWHCYDIRGSDDDFGELATLEPNVLVNHAGSILSPQPISFPDGQNYLNIREEINFVEPCQITLAEFCTLHKINAPSAQTKYAMRPASPEEAGLFYSQMEPEQDMAEGTVGHLRMDFGGGRLHHSWWPHNDDRFNTPELKAVLQELVDELRASGPLKDQSAMSKWCHQHADSKIQDGHYGFIVETADHRFCLRCTTMRGDYSYLYCYDLNQQRQAMETSQAQQEQSRIGQRRQTAWHHQRRYRH